MHQDNFKPAVSYKQSIKTGFTTPQTTDANQQYCVQVNCNTESVLCTEIPILESSLRNTGQDLPYITIQVGKQLALTTNSISNLLNR